MLLGDILKTTRKKIFQNIYSVVFIIFASLTLCCQESCLTELHFSKSQLFFAFTLDTFVKLTKYFLDTLLKNLKSKHEVLSEYILTWFWASCFMFWAETFFNCLKKGFCKSYLITKAYLQLETSTQNKSHRCVKDISFETDFQSRDA